MRTYQDGTAVGGFGLLGCLGGVWSGIRPSMYTYQEKYDKNPLNSQTGIICH